MKSHPSQTTAPDKGRSVQQRVEAALAALRAGRPVLLQDDEDRENEADLIVAASMLTEQTMALLIRECSGIVCLCLTPAHAQHLELRPMVEHNRSRYGTAFTVSIEARTGVGTGVSALDRLRTVQAATAPDAQADDIVSPGHVFPLVAAEGGVLVRRGHTEGAVDLARLADLPPAAVLCELMNHDGSLARGDAVRRFSALHDLPILSIEDLVSYRSDQHAPLAVV